MDKYEALYSFYSGFGIPAYEENSVPDDAKMPYIAYEVITGSYDAENIALSCQIFFKDTSLAAIDRITEKLSGELSGGKKIPCDTGYIVLYRGSPFAQNTSTGDKSVKSKYVNITADYITL